MLTEVKAYSAWRSAPTLLLDADGRPETDLIQIRNIDGIDPVKASVTTSAYGSIDGASYTGSSVQTRNIVLTLHPNPNWNTMTYESLRRLLYSYFMPKLQVRLVFYSDDMVPVEIYGRVESAAINPFSKDPEMLVSIICPDPYFTALDPVVLTGQAVRANGAETTITYDGSIEGGVNLKVTWASGATPTYISVMFGPDAEQLIVVDATVDATSYFELSSIPLKKFIQNVSLDTGNISGLLSKVEAGGSWPILEPGENLFKVVTDQGVQDWELTYYERFGGL